MTDRAYWETLNENILQYVALGSYGLSQPILTRNTPVSQRGAAEMLTKTSYIYRMSMWCDTSTHIIWGHQYAGSCRNGVREGLTLFS